MIRGLLMTTAVLTALSTGAAWAQSQYGTSPNQSSPGSSMGTDPTGRTPGTTTRPGTARTAPGAPGGASDSETMGSSGSSGAGGGSGTGTSRAPGSTGYPSTDQGGNSTTAPGRTGR